MAKQDHLSEVAAFGIALLVFASAATAKANIIYTYTGNDFTIVSAPYTTSNHITGNFTTSSPLADNLTEAQIVPGAFSFTDGSINTISSLTGTSGRRFVVSTDSMGDITSWDVTLILGLAPTNSALFTCSGISTFGSSCPNNPFDESYLNNGASSGGVNSNPGTWSESMSGAVPEPASAALLATGLLGLLGIVRRWRTA